MSYNKFIDWFHLSLSKLGFRTERYKRIITEKKLKYFLDNKTTYKTKSVQEKHIKIVEVADWSDVYILFCSLIWDRENIEKIIGPRKCLYRANGLSLECTRSNGEKKYCLYWDKYFRTDGITELLIVTSSPI